VRFECKLQGLLCLGAGRLRACSARQTATAMQIISTANTEVSPLMMRTAVVLSSRDDSDGSADVWVAILGG
jgi:hypothetical protein